MPPRPAPAGRRAQDVIPVHSALRDNVHTRGKRQELENERDNDISDKGDKGSSFGQSNSNAGPSNSGSLKPDFPSSGPSNSGFGSSNSSYPSNFGCITCVVRDNDARLLYKGAWSLDKNPAFTTHSTTASGSSVSFKFNGSGIVVFGTVPQSNGTNPPPKAAYILDAAQPFVTTEPSANRNIPSQPLFAAFRLSPEEHSITINIQRAQSPFILERFFVFPRVNLTQQAVDAGHPSPTPSFGSATPVPKAQNTTTDSQVTVRILAGILGSLVALITLAGLYLLYIRRRRRKASLSLVLERSPSSSSRGLRETIFTSTESILRNNPSIMWSHYTQSEAGRGSIIDYYQSPPPPMPPPLPPKA